MFSVWQRRMKCFISQVVIFLVIVSPSWSKDLSPRHGDVLSQREVVGFGKRSVEARSAMKMCWYLSSDSLSFSSAVSVGRIWQSTLLRNVPLMSQLTSKVCPILISLFANIMHKCWLRWFHRCPTISSPLPMMLSSWSVLSKQGCSCCCHVQIV